jgi:hypothetical protein
MVRRKVIGEEEEDGAATSSETRTSRPTVEKPKNLGWVRDLRVGVRWLP